MNWKWQAIRLGHKLFKRLWKNGGHEGAEKYSKKSSNTVDDTIVKMIDNVAQLNL